MTARRRVYSGDELYEHRKSVDAFKFQYDARRIAETQSLVSFRFLRGDLHTHTRYSDGKGTVAENWVTAEARGLDFLFITDHGTIRQKAECKKFRTVWWGQEPGRKKQHICVLDNERKFTSNVDIAVDVARLRELGLFFFFPHPSGWFPRMWYLPERVAEIDNAGDDFALEVMNGIFRTDPFHDEWTDKNLEIWDRYLSRGRRVIGLAASDAHMPATVGNVWTGVLGARNTRSSVLKALREGRVFASSGPALNLTAGGAGMSGVARPKAGKLAIAFECADAYGLKWARVIQDGKEAKCYRYGNVQHAVEKLVLPVSRKTRYVRVECAAQDDRRAYANPIYLAGSR